MNNKQFGHLLLAGLFLLFAAADVTADESDWYLGIGINAYDIELNNESYFPRQLGVYGGYWLVPGIGLELQAGVDAGAYNSGGFELGVNSRVSALVRWQTPGRRTARAYILTGYSQLELDGAVEDSGFPGEESFGGPVLGIGVMFSPDKTSPWSAGVGYSHYFLDDDMKTESIDAAVQYDF